MLCGCLDWDRSLNNKSRKHGAGGVLYPGQRRAQFQSTAGNALRATNQPNSLSPITPQQQPLMGVPPPNQNNNNINELVAVTVQEGMSPGQMINVTSPDGTGRMTSVCIPHGLRAGETFMVEFPPGSTSNLLSTHNDNNYCNNNNNNNNHPQLQIKSPNTNHSITLPALPTAKPIAVNNNNAIPAMAVAQEEEEREPQIAIPVSSDVMPQPSAPPVTALPPPSTNKNNYNGNNNNNNNNTYNNNNNNTSEKYVLVQVPPGTPPGTTLHVQIPGESGKIIAAQVPPGNVSQFHVSYRSEQQQPTPVVQGQQQQQQPTEKLVLVQVPPGTAPGTTLHVQIPGENGRIIAAQVPPGNVSQFHVSYQPSQQPQPQFHNNVSTAQQPSYYNCSNNNNNNNYPSSYMNNNPTNGYNNYNNNNRFNNNQGRNNLNRGYGQYGNNNNNRNNGSGVMGYVAPVLAGAALMGAAGYMIGHHNHQNHYGNEGQYDNLDQSYDNHENNYENDYENNNGMENEAPEDYYDDAGGGDDFDVGGDY